MYTLIEIFSCKLSTTRLVTPFCQYDGIAVSISKSNFKTKPAPIKPLRKIVYV